MIPVKFGETSWRRQHFDEDNNNGKLWTNLDLIHEVCKEAHVRVVATHHRGARRYNTWVREQAFQKGDLV